ncbi:VanZ family protein [Luteolibacter soli]|uniref:VanZ-like domain-containing protein n=1 Tax=Luteolibacter soli TaxID=3135280 RepID=A0ABU9AV76_9BACT
MRRAFLPILPLALLLLIAGTWLAWQHRFEIDPSYPHLSLDDLVRDAVPDPGVTIQRNPAGNTEVTLTAGNPSSAVVQLLPLPLPGKVEFLMFDFAVKAEGLVPGPSPWSDGRVMIEWHPAHHRMEAQYLVSSRGNDAAENPCVVDDSPHGPAVPVLRLEHLGSSGSFHLKHCRIDVVRETAWWRIGHWVLLAGWFAWAAVVATWGRTSGLGASLLAAALWVFCVTQWAVPGPWGSIRPLAPLFAISEPAGRAVLSAPAVPPAAKPPASTATPPAQVPKSLGELPFGGSLLLEIKDRIKQARPLFHTLLFLGPTLVLVFLIGRWKSAVFAALLAGAIEWSQYLFGFGFDESDLFDLSFDALGVVLAILVHSRLSRWWRERKVASELAAAGDASASQAT